MHLLGAFVVTQVHLGGLLQYQPLALTASSGPGLGHVVSVSLNVVPLRDLDRLVLGEQRALGGNDVRHVVVVNEEDLILRIEIDLDTPEKDGQTAMDLLELDVVTPRSHLFHVARPQYLRGIIRYSKEPPLRRDEPERRLLCRSRVRTRKIAPERPDAILAWMPEDTDLLSTFFAETLQVAVDVAPVLRQEDARQEKQNRDR